MSGNNGDDSKGRIGYHVHWKSKSFAESSCVFLRGFRPSICLLMRFPRLCVGHQGPNAQLFVLEHAVNGPQTDTPDRSSNEISHEEVAVRAAKWAKSDPVSSDSGVL